MSNTNGNVQVYKAKMIELLKRNGIKDKNVLKAFEIIDRHIFVKGVSLKDAYGDFPLSIGYGQTISQPHMIAIMLEALKLKSSDRVLEIGSGCGYVVALLSTIVKHVWGIEIIKELAIKSQENLKLLNIKNATIINADGKMGYEREAPYDKIIVSCAPTNIPERLKEQLNIGGIMAIPIGKGIQKLLIIKKMSNNQFSIHEDIYCRFVPMI